MKLTLKRLLRRLHRQLRSWLAEPDDVPAAEVPFDHRYAFDPLPYRRPGLGTAFDGEGVRAAGDWWCPKSQDCAVMETALPDVSRREHDSGCARYPIPSLSGG
jgi:hypothetical protein